MTIRERIANAWGAFNATPDTTELTDTINAIVRAELEKARPKGRDISAWTTQLTHGDRSYGTAGKPFDPGPINVEPYQFQFSQGVNLIATPRAGYGLIPFHELRQLAEMALEVRLPIEVMKREVRAMEWAIVPQPNIEVDVSTEIEDATALVKHPDGFTSFDAWVNAVIEEMLVTDAVTLFPNTETDPVALEMVDGASIVPLLDDLGRTPSPPLPAYSQIIYGQSKGGWSRDELWYLPFNKPVYQPYGKSAVENIIISVNTALRRANQRLNHYTEGNTPDSIVGLPENWTIQQIKDFQTHWDALIAGSASKTSRMRFFPTQGNSIPLHEFNKTDSDIVLDEWLLRVGCWAVGVSPSELGLTPGSGLGGAGYAKGQAEVQYRQGIGPITQYLTDIFNRLLEASGYENVNFKWQTATSIADVLTQAQIDQTNIQARIYTPEFVQERDGIPVEMRPEPLPEPVAQEQFSFFGKAAPEPDPEPDLAERLKVEDAITQMLQRYLRGLRSRIVTETEAEVLQ